MLTTIIRDDRKDDDPTGRDIAATVSTGGSTTGNAPDPWLKGPIRDPPNHPNHLFSWARALSPRVPGNLYPLSPPLFYALPTYGY